MATIFACRRLILATSMAVVLVTPASSDDLVVVSSTRPPPPAMPPITVNTLVSRPRTPPFTIMPADAVWPRAIVLLFPGADGWLNIDLATNTPGRLMGNFVVRTRAALAGMGFLVVLVDAPSDRQNTTGVSGGFRATKDHAMDLASVAAHFKPTVSGTAVNIGPYTFGMAHCKHLP